MKRLLLTLILMFAIAMSFASIVYTTVNTSFIKCYDNDKITNATAVNGYATNKDGIASTAFDGNKLSNRTIWVVSTITDTIDGTSVNHLTPVLQGSPDNSTWADITMLEEWSSSAVTIGTSWTFYVYVPHPAPYLRIVYVYHTSANANISDATNIGGIRTTIIVSAK